MPFDPHENLVLGVIIVAPNPPESGTTLSISNEEAEYFPDPVEDGEYNVTVWAVGEMPQRANAEIIRITAKGEPDSGGEGNTEFTIVREQEDTLPREIEAEDMIALTITKKTVKDIEDRVLEVGDEVAEVEAILGAKPQGSLADLTARLAVSLADDGKLKRDVFNVAYYGDGKTDVEIQAALDAAKNAGGGIVFIPTGTWIISTTLKITASNIHLVGEGQATYIKLANATNKAMISAKSNSTQLTGIRIANFYLDGNKANQTVNQSGLEMGKCAYSTLENVRVVNAKYIGIAFGELTESTVKNCWAENNGEHGIWVGHDCARVLVEGCRALGNTWDGIVLDSDNNIVSGCVARNNGASGIYLDPVASKNILNNNIVLSNGNYGIDLGNDCSCNTIVGNYIKDNSSGGVGCAGSQNTIVGNVCINNDQGGAGTEANILIKATGGGTGDYNTIIGNRTSDCPIGIKLTVGADRNIVLGNSNYGQAVAISDGGANNEVAHNA